MTDRDLGFHLRRDGRILAAARPKIVGRSKVQIVEAITDSEVNNKPLTYFVIRALVDTERL